MTKAGLLSLCSSVLIFLMDQDSLICQGSLEITTLRTTDLTVPRLSA